MKKKKNDPLEQNLDVNPDLCHVLKFTVTPSFFELWKCPRYQNCSKMLKLLRCKVEVLSLQALLAQNRLLAWQKLPPIAFFTNFRPYFLVCSGHSNASNIVSRAFLKLLGNEFLATHHELNPSRNTATDTYKG